MDEIRPPTTLSTALPSAWIERLFARLAMTYGNKFADMWAGQDVASVRQMWASEMTGYTADEIRGGLERMRSKHPSWPPSCYEFMDLCRPALDHESAFHEALRGLNARREGKPGEWSSRAVYWAASDVTAFDMLNLTWPQIKSRWCKALDARLADPNLPPIPDIPKALPAPPRDDEIPKAIVAKVGATARRNPRAWVEKILERKARADTSLSEIAYRKALESESIR